MGRLPRFASLFAEPDYMLAMKALAGRPEDITDIQALAAYIGLSTSEEILAIISTYIYA